MATLLNKSAQLKIDIQNAQKAWAELVVKIGEVRDDKKEYERIANETLDSLYDFESQGDFILFKPTIASEVPVRINRDQTASYFIGGGIIEEDRDGFARTPWEEVSFEEEFNFTVLDSGDVLVMGRCTFKTTRAVEAPHERTAVADYTFGYRPDGMRIFLHHSSKMVVREVNEAYT